MLVLADEQIDRIIGYRRQMFLGGLAWFVLMLTPLIPEQFKIGFFTSFTILGYGEFAFVLKKWRTDRGLWMLATLLVVIYGPILACVEFWEFTQLLKPGPGAAAVRKGWVELRFACDCSLALMVLGKIVRFAFSVVVRNWQLTHPSRSSEQPRNSTNYLD